MAPPTPRSHSLLLFLVLAWLGAFGSADTADNRFVEIFPGKCTATDDLVISKLDIHPQGEEPNTHEITGSVSLVNQLPCETVIYRYVYWWVPVNTAEMNVSTSLEAAQSAAGPELSDMGLPAECPVPPGDYTIHWAPDARVLLSPQHASGRLVIGFDAFDRAAQNLLLSCEFHVHVRRKKTQ